MRTHARMLMLFTLLAGLYLVRECQLSPLKEVDAAFVQWLSGNVPSTTGPAPLTLVQITDSCLGEAGNTAPGEKHGWPWPPLDYALFLQAAGSFEAPVVGIQPVLAWETMSNESNEKRLEFEQYARLLHNALLRVPKALLGAELGFVDDPSSPGEQAVVPTIRRVEGDRNLIPEFTAVASIPEEDFRLSPILGFTNLDGSKPVTRVPLLFRYRGEMVPSFVLQSLMLWYQLTPDDIKVVCGSQVELGSKIRIPIDDAGTMEVDFRAPFERIAYDDLILLVQQSQAEGDAPAKANPQADRIRGSMLMLARSDSGAPSYRLGNGQRGTAADAFAAAIAMVQKEQFVNRLPLSAGFGFLLIGIGIGPMLLRLTRLGVVAITTLIICVYLILAVTLFSLTAIALPFALPVGLILFTSLFALFVR